MIWKTHIEVVKIHVMLIQDLSEQSEKELSVNVASSKGNVKNSPQSSRFENIIIEQGLPHCQ